MGNDQRSGILRTILLLLFLALILASAVLLYAKSQDIWWFAENDRNDTNDQTDNGDEDKTPKSEGFSIDSEQGEEILITMPDEVEEVTCPIMISGNAPGTWYFEASFPIEIIGDDDRSLGNSTATALEDWMTEEYVDFSATLYCDECKAGESYTLRLIKDNPSGLAQYDDSASFDIKLSEECTSKEPDDEMMTLEVYFLNNIRDPEMLDCTKVYSVTRSVEETVAVARSAIEELLKGPTDIESANGYITQIPDDVTLNDIWVEDGVITADFSSELQEGVGGSCKVQAIRTQIESTLLQFPTVEEVVISIEGETDMILQP